MCIKTQLKMYYKKPGIVKRKNHNVMLVRNRTRDLNIGNSTSIPIPRPANCRSTSKLWCTVKRANGISEIERRADLNA
jgi:hypothetical protein